VLALSTSCLVTADEDPSVDRRIAALLEQDVEGYELGYRIVAGEIEAFGRAIRGTGRRVTSLHSYCPVPSGIRPSEAGGDLLLLTAEDGTMRERGVKATIATLEWAARLEAPTVVIHGGRTPIEYPKQRVRELYDTGRWSRGEGEAILRRLAADRAATAERALDLLRISLDRIIVSASRLQVSIALENRIHPHEIPNAAEFAPLLGTFRGAPIGTWFDTGHAHTQEVLGFSAPGETWDAMRVALLGCHVHDVAGIQDHLPPGEGELDLGERLRELPMTLPLVIECRPGQGKERLARGIDSLARALGRTKHDADGQGPVFLG